MSAGFRRTTNNRMELMAVIVALFLSVPYWKGKYFVKHPQHGKEAAPHA